MTSFLADRLKKVKPSVTLSISAKAAELKSQGKNILNLSVGEPDFDTPQLIKNAAIDAINSGFTKYTATAGILELRQAIVKKLQHDNQLSYSPKQIIVSTG